VCRPFRPRLAPYRGDKLARCRGDKRGASVRAASLASSCEDRGEDGAGPTARTSSGGEEPKWLWTGEGCGGEGNVDAGGERMRLEVESAARTSERPAIERGTLEIVARGRCVAEAIVETAES